MIEMSIVLSRFGPFLPDDGLQRPDGIPPPLNNESELTCPICQETIEAGETVEWHREATFTGRYGEVGRRFCCHIGHRECPTMPGNGFQYLSRCPECNGVWDRLATPAPEPVETPLEQTNRLQREMNAIVRLRNQRLSDINAINYWRAHEDDSEQSTQGRLIAEALPGWQRQVYNVMALQNNLAMPFPDGTLSDMEDESSTSGDDSEDAEE